MMSEFKSIGDILGGKEGMQQRMDEFQVRRQEIRDARLVQFGWSEKVQCDQCGDTGINPETNRSCRCDKGQDIEHRRRAAADWPRHVPPRFVEYTLDGHPNQVAAQIVREWFQHGFPKGRNLVLTGSVGSGKTGLAVGAMREVYRQRKKVLFGTLLTYLDMMRPQGNEDPVLDVHEMSSVDLLVIDDIGTEKMTEWAAERLMAIIDNRHTHLLPTIITTNLKLQEDGLGRRRTLADVLGERGFSRVMSDATVVPVAGRDLRQRRAS